MIFVARSNSDAPPSLSNLLDDIAGTVGKEGPATLLIDRDVVVEGTVNVPPSIDLWFVGIGTLVAKDATSTVGLERAPRAGLWQIFGYNHEFYADRKKQLGIGSKSDWIRTIPEAADAIAWMKRCEAGRFDLVFIDPPFDSALFDEALSASARLLAAQGFVYLESPQPCTDASTSGLGLAVHRHARAGQVHAHLLRPSAAGAGEDDAG